MLKIGVLVSGSGSNLQSIIDAIEKGSLNCSIEAVISDNEKAYALKRAEQKGIPAYAISKKVYGEKLPEEILKILKGKVDIIVLAGFLSVLKGDILKEFENKIINIHPSLIPSFCGKGMYGIKVHEAVLKAGAKITGCTVHFVNHKVDGGAIILQKPVPVYFEDDAETLQKRVLKEEHEILVEAIRLVSEGKLEIISDRVRIDNSELSRYNL